MEPTLTLNLYVAKAAFELLILLPPPPKGWDYKCMPSHLAKVNLLETLF